MAEVQIVAKALNDLADEWHWVVLHDAQPMAERQYWASRVDTLCGLLLHDVPSAVTLYDMGAPDQPTCRRCLDGGVDPGLVAQLEAVLEEAEATPVTVEAG